MFCEDRLFRDQQGTIVAPGDFVELLETKTNLLKGPLKYDGFRNGSHVWSVGGNSFIYSDIKSSDVRRLNWRRWRKWKERSEQFWGFLS